MRTPKGWFDLRASRSEIEQCPHGGTTDRSVVEAKVWGTYPMLRTRTVYEEAPDDDAAASKNALWSYRFEEITIICQQSGATLACGNFSTATAKPRKPDHPLDRQAVNWTPATKLSLAKDGTLVVSEPTTK